MPVSAARARSLAAAFALLCACADTLPLEPGQPRDAGPGDAGAAPPDSGLDPRDLAWVQPLAEATCAREQRCAPVRLIREHGEEQECVDDLVLQWSTRASVIAAAVAAGRSARRDGALEACLDALATAPCAGGATDEVCRLFQGLVAPGSACLISEECRSGYCDGDGDRCRTCRAFAPYCSPDEPCAPNLVCDYDVCVPRRAAGDRCGNGAGACGPGLVCWGQPLTCQRLGSEGEACIDTGAGLDTCDRGRGLRCVTERCVQGRVAPSGDVCGAAAVAACAPGSYCDDSGLTCEPLLDVGAACTDHTRCVRGARCDINTGQCRAFMGPGERCDEWLCRSDLLCVDGVCTPPAWQVCP